MKTCSKNSLSFWQRAQQLVRKQLKGLFLLIFFSFLLWKINSANTSTTKFPQEKFWFSLGNYSSTNASVELCVGMMLRMWFFGWRILMWRGPFLSNGHLQHFIFLLCTSMTIVPLVFSFFWLKMWQWLEQNTTFTIFKFLQNEHFQLPKSGWRERGV